MPGDVDVHKPATLDLHYDEHIEHPEGRRDHHTELAGQDGLGMVSDDDGLPLLSCPAPSPAGPAGQIAADGARRHAEAELQEQLHGDPLLAPRRIASGHGRDHSLKVRRAARPPRAGPPAPEEAKGLSVPPEEGCGPNDRQGLAPEKAPRNKTNPIRTGPDARWGWTWRSRYKASCFRRKKFSAARAIRERRLAPRNRTRSIPSATPHAAQVTARLDNFHGGSDSPASGWNSRRCMRF